MGNISSKSRRFDSVPGEQFSPEKSCIFFFSIPLFEAHCLFNSFLSPLLLRFSIFHFCSSKQVQSFLFTFATPVFFFSTQCDSFSSPAPVFRLLLHLVCVAEAASQSRSGLVGSWRSTVMDSISSKSRRFDSVL
ncbi:hypothetical protein V8C34DRAFT_10526 [Trichoderma compactum]